jgi:hypothetical protein
MGIIHTLQAAKTKILTAIVRSAPGLKGYTSNAAMEQQILQHFQLVPKLRKAPNIKLVVWKTPLILWYKANTRWFHRWRHGGLWWAVS